jgi:predicted ATPase
MPAALSHNPKPRITSSVRSFVGGGMALPRPLTALITRDKEQAAVVPLLRDPAVRLVTLTGPDGVGKTRLAIAAAAAVTNAFPDGVVFIDLAPVASPGLVVATIARCLGLRDTGAESLHDRLSAAIADRRLLLVLDNVDQVVAAAPRLHSLLVTCAAVRLLVTSRIRLRVSGEREFPVAPFFLDAPTAVEVAKACVARGGRADRAVTLRWEGHP